MKKNIDEYFQKARSWYDDVYIEAIASRNRYRFAFLWCLLIISLLATSFLFLFPLQHTQLILVHHMDDGTIWVEQTHKRVISIDRAQIESDIVRYVINRESYNPFEYDHQYALVNLLSDGEVAKEYQKNQDATNLHSPINHFKNRYTRRVRVQNIIFLNKNPKNPLAQVNFIIIDHDHMTGRETHQALLAIVSWKYRGIPKDPVSQWMNWDGFTMTHYSIQQRNI